MWTLAHSIKVRNLAHLKEAREGCAVFYTELRGALTYDAAGERYVDYVPVLCRPRGTLATVSTGEDLDSGYQTRTQKNKESAAATGFTRSRWRSYSLPVRAVPLARQDLRPIEPFENEDAEFWVTRDKLAAAPMSARECFAVLTAPGTSDGELDARVRAIEGRGEYSSEAEAGRRASPLQLRHATASVGLHANFGCRGRWARLRRRHEVRPAGGGDLDGRRVVAALGGGRRCGPHSRDPIARR